MGKIRIYQLARELDIKSTELVDMLKELGIEAKSHMSTLEDETADLVKEMLAGDREGGQAEEQDSPEVATPIKIEAPVNVKKIGEALQVNPNQIIKQLIEEGIMVNLTQNLTGDALQQVEKVLDIKVHVEEEETPETQKEKGARKKKKQNLVHRPPVVTIMGHVDHGKTQLLDVIREANVVASEAGGITQHIGAYQVEVNGRKISFLDTPGHEAFTAMRARGAQVTDIAILVIAADDGIMPQTVEAINHAQDAKIPIIVALNKIDKENANPERVKQQLTEYHLVPEEWGGETVVVEISALERINIEELLEMILLVADVEDIKADPEDKAEGVIVEAELDKGRGPVATVLIKEGTLRVGEAIIAGLAYGRVRAMINDKGERVKTAGPSTPVEVLGLSDVPVAGDFMETVPSEKEAKKIAGGRREKQREKEISSDRPANLEQFFARMQEEEVKELKIIIKGDVQGSVEALKDSLNQIKSEDVNLNIIHSGVGAITENDVILASASRAIIIGFNVRPDSRARRIGEQEGVDIRTYRIIYQVIDDVKKALEGLLDPEIREKVLGRAEVRETFRVPKAGTVAGLYVTDGKITRNSKVRVLRDGVVIHEGNIGSLKRFQDDVREVEANYECGLNVEGFQDVKVGDIIEAFVFEEIKRKLTE